MNALNALVLVFLAAAAVVSGNDFVRPSDMRMKSYVWERGEPRMPSGEQRGGARGRLVLYAKKTDRKI